MQSVRIQLSHEILSRSNTFRGEGLRFRSLIIIGIFQSAGCKAEVFGLMVQDIGLRV